MALTNRFKISMLDVFPHGAYLVSEVEPVRDFDKSSAGRPVQAVDKESGLPVWAATRARPPDVRLPRTRNGSPAAASGGTG